jgi:hypothetical protein
MWQEMLGYLPLQGRNCFYYTFRKPKHRFVTRYLDDSSRYNTVNHAVKHFFRDGSSVEIVGLSKSTVRWLADMAKKKMFPFDGVKDDNTGGSYTIKYR